MIVTVYTMMGGFIAAAMTDVVQGFLIDHLLAHADPPRAGPDRRLRRPARQGPDFMFKLFGSVTTSEYAWYTILAMVLANLVSIIASARHDADGRLGQERDDRPLRHDHGHVLQALLMIFWALTGLLAVALYSAASSTIPT